MSNYLIHFNGNHSSKNGQFVAGDGDKDGIIDDHHHYSKNKKDLKNTIKNKYNNSSIKPKIDEAKDFYKQREEVLKPILVQSGKSFANIVGGKIKIGSMKVNDYISVGKEMIDRSDLGKVAKETKLKENIKTTFVDTKTAVKSGWNDVKSNWNEAKRNIRRG